MDRKELLQIQKALLDLHNWTVGVRGGWTDPADGTLHGVLTRDFGQAAEVLRLAIKADEDYSAVVRYEVGDRGRFTTEGWPVLKITTEVVTEASTVDDAAKLASLLSRRQDDHGTD